MTAAEAREIVAHPERVIQDHTTENLYNIAEGYLEALEAPEVKALIKAIKEYKEKYFDRAENHDDLTDEAKEIIKALSQYREAVKE